MVVNHKRYAVVVGVSEYEDDISPLPCAKSDALRLGSILPHQAMFGSDRVYLLANGPDSTPELHTTSPTRANILQRLKYVCDAAGPDDLVLFYFAGHGAEVSKTPYLLSCDTKMDVLSQTALNVDEINEMLQASKAKCMVRLFDACRAPFGEGRGAMGRMTPGLQDAVLKCATGWASFCSCSSGEIAHESGELNQGVFSYYLCEGLSGKARNNEGDVTITSLVDYVNTSVSNWCDRQTQKQTPHFQSDLSGPLVLASPPRPIQKDEPILQSPFLELVTGLEAHLGKTAEDTRRLTFTSAEEWKAVAETLHARIKAKLDDFSHLTLRLEASVPEALSNFGNPCWSSFQEDMAACEVQKESVGNPLTTKVDFISTEVVVPKTTLYVAL